jgi:hypothetical protein
MEAEMGVMEPHKPRNPADCQEPPAAGRNKEGLSLRAFRGSRAWPAL